MISMIFIVVVIAGAGYLAWRRWTDWRTPISPQSSAERSQQTHAFEAFAHGNSCLMAGQWQARTLDPKQPYVAERLAEVARQQHAASALAPVTAGG